MNLLSLPKDVLRYLFAKYLGPLEIALLASLCRSLREIASTPMVWEHQGGAVYAIDSLKPAIDQDVWSILPRMLEERDDCHDSMPSLESSSLDAFLESAERCRNSLVGCCLYVGLEYMYYAERESIERERATYRVVMRGQGRGELVLFGVKQTKGTNTQPILGGCSRLDPFGSRHWGPLVRYLLGRQENEHALEHCVILEPAYGFSRYRLKISQSFAAQRVQGFTAFFPQMLAEQVECSFGVMAVMENRGVLWSTLHNAADESAARKCYTGYNPRGMAKVKPSLHPEKDLAEACAATVSLFQALYRRDVSKIFPLVLFVPDFFCVSDFCERLDFAHVVHVQSAENPVEVAMKRVNYLRKSVYWRPHKLK